MNKSVILVASLTLAVLLIVGIIFTVGQVSAVKPIIQDPLPDADQWCKDNTPSGACNPPTSYMCKDDFDDGKHKCQYQCIGGVWTNGKTCGLAECDDNTHQCKVSVVTS
jgi:hypothetical protein